MKTSNKAAVRDSRRPVPTNAETRLRDLSPEHRRIVESVFPFTMASEERIASLLDAVDYVLARHLPGDIAECGVWRGGCMMAVALRLVARAETGRDLWLYDTFAGMTEPSEHDVRFDGETARAELDATPSDPMVWCRADLAEVTHNMLTTGYPRDKIHFVQGKVEETIPERVPSRLSLLRLDTDWFESTKHELIHLYPRLEQNGILIIDDYGHWRGARKAVDEFFQERGETPYLHRVDYTARTIVKDTA